MNTRLTAVRILLAMFLLVTVAQSLRAEEITGKWYRRDGGRVVDVMIIERVGHGYQVTFKESEQSPAYGEARGYFRDGTLWMALVNLQSGGSGFAVYQLTAPGTFAGKTLNVDGKVRWEGTFTR